MSGDRIMAPLCREERSGDSHSSNDENLVTGSERSAVPLSTRGNESGKDRAEPFRSHTNYPASHLHAGAEALRNGAYT